ncbi:MAG: hypothetical protein WC341_06360, partial [Bacteroidales bacterium]
LENVFLTVKLHPVEKYDAAYYQDIAVQTGCKNYEIVSHADLYNLINDTDIVVTCFSTVGAESVYFFKPLIILDHLMQDIQNYHRDGIAFQAWNSTTLREYIELFINNKLLIDTKKYNEYIDRYAYKIDGKVADRVLEFILSL